MALSPRVALAALALADALALAALRHCPSAVWAHGSNLRTWLEAGGPDAAIATLAGAAIWAVALWVAIGLAATSAARVPGVTGAVARGISRVMLPRAVRVLLLGTTGLGVLLTPVAAGAAPASSGSLPAPRWPVVATSSDAPTSTGAPAPAPVLPAPTWPSAAPTTTSLSPTTPRSGTTPSSSPADTPVRTSAHTSAVTRAPSARPASRTRTTDHPSTHPVAGGRERSGDVVTVRPGDSLWLLAAQRVSGSHAGTRVDAARVAAEWPRWYRANRHALGGDPDLLVPGQVLHVPTGIPARGEAP